MNMKNALAELLEKHDQTQLLAFWNTLDEAGKDKLAAQINDIDFDTLDTLIADYVLRRPETAIPDDLKPAPFFPLVPAGEKQAAYYAEAEKAGKEALCNGKIALLTVAGGQGTRLGFDGPKGTYPIGPVTGRTLFQYFADAIARAGEKYGCDFLWYIMTSQLNNKATVEFFRANNFFGLSENNVRFFVQGTMPAVDYNGKLLLADKDSLALSPDGHGGTLLALRRSGALAEMAAKGVEYISYFQVDNPLVPVVNPLFIGLHILEKSEMSAIMLSKTGPYEKLGNFCVSGGRTQIIEYSDLPASLAESRNEDGTLRFVAGSPAIHIIDRAFVDRLTAGGKLSLPWHRADKKVPYIDADGAAVKPEEPNAVKLESFIFDALPLAERTMILEADRFEQFGPTKNATGVDSAESCRELLMERDRRRLTAAGITVPAGKIEIPPRLAIDQEDIDELAAKNGIVFTACGDGFIAE